MSKEIEKLSFLLKLIGDQTRLTILSFLKDRELCVCDLVALLGLSQPAISQHLKKLKQAGIVVERKAGTWVHFRLNNEIDPYIDGIIKLIPSVQDELYLYLNAKQNRC